MARTTLLARLTLLIAEQSHQLGGSLSLYGTEWSPTVIVRSSLVATPRSDGSESELMGVGCCAAAFASDTDF
jgi:hypothetical protein